MSACHPILENPSCMPSVPPPHSMYTPVSVITNRLRLARSSAIRKHHPGMQLLFAGGTHMFACMHGITCMPTYCVFHTVTYHAPDGSGPFHLEQGCCHRPTSRHERQRKGISPSRLPTQKNTQEESYQTMRGVPPLPCPRVWEGW